MAGRDSGEAAIVNVRANPLFGTAAEKRGVAMHPSGGYYAEFPWKSIPPSWHGPAILRRWRVPNPFVAIP